MRKTFLRALTCFALMAAVNISIGCGMLISADGTKSTKAGGPKSTNAGGAPKSTKANR